MRNKELSCSFCEKHRKAVNKLIAGTNVYICDECVDLCNEIIWEEQRLENIDGVKKIGDLPKPKEIYARLNEYIIDQDEAKKVLSVAVYNHYKRVFETGPKFKAAPEVEEDVELEKSNVLLLGPTGCGKTLLAKTLAKILNVPFAIADATSLTEAGYVGEDVENVILLLLQNADNDEDLASRGIIYIDEIDKIARKGGNASITRDVSGEGVQQALLKLIEGTIASIPPKGGRKHPNQEMTKVDTKNILFICGGAFAGLESIIESRLGKKALGFRAGPKAEKEVETSSIFNHVLPQDLVKFGLIPEFIGRVPVTTSVEDLTEEALLRILTEPKGALVKQYVRLFEMDGIKLTFTEEALKAVVRKAVKLKTGARGLRSVIENAITNTMFESPSRENLREVVVDEDTILNGAEANYLCEENPDEAA